MDEREKKQVEMHADFFDRCKVTLDQGFYLEAIFMEYAAMEARLESICGVAGLPCGRDCNYRKDIKISHRIECLQQWCLSPRKFCKHLFGGVDKFFKLIPR